MEYLSVNKDIYLKKIKPADAGIIYETIQNDRNYLRRWLPFVDQTSKKEDTAKFIKVLTTGPEKEKNIVFTVWYCNEFAGLASFKDIDSINHKTEIGYWLAEKMQGKGIMTQTVKKMIEYGFRDMNFNRIQIKVAQGNLKSSAIPVRLGLLFEGIERDGEFHTDQYFDIEVFSIIKKEWVESLTPGGLPTD